MFRFLTAGESHGQALVAIVEGVPAGLDLDVADINGDLARRQKGHGRGGRMSIERDQAQILSGLRFGKTLGSPIALTIANRDWPAWEGKMSVDNPENADPDAVAVYIPRPGHADLSGGIKYGHSDMRNVLERASARETATRVAVGAIARKMLAAVGVSITSHVISIGSASSKPSVAEGMSIDDIRNKSENSPVRCLDPDAEAQMLAIIDEAASVGDTLGGTFEVIAHGLPVGLGSYVHWDRKLDGLLAQSVMSIPAIKGVEIGLGFQSAELPGSQVHDEIGYNEGYFRYTNRAGGIEGGMTNGEPLIIRAAMKPIPTLIKRLRSVDTRTKQPAPAHAERSDVCAVPAAAVVAEAMVAITLIAATIDKFGGDTMDELKERIQTY